MSKQKKERGAEQHCRRCREVFFDDDPRVVSLDRMKAELKRRVTAEDCKDFCLCGRCVFVIAVRRAKELEFVEADTKIRSVRELVAAVLPLLKRDPRRPDREPNVIAHLTDTDKLSIRVRQLLRGDEMRAMRLNEEQDRRERITAACAEFDAVEIVRENGSHEKGGYVDGHLPPRGMSRKQMLRREGRDRRGRRDRHAEE